MQKKTVDIMSKIKKLRSDLKKLEETKAKSIMSDLKNFLAQNPEIESICWQQYTPHFNDGDVCEFNVYGPYIMFNDEFHKADPENDYMNGYLDAGKYGQINEDFFEKKSDILNHNQITKLRKAVDNFNNMFEDLRSMEHILAEMFGDGVQVVVTRGGVEVEDYDHD